MKLLYRLGFYFFGFFVGIILLSVIFKGKKSWNSKLVEIETFDSISFHEFLDMARIDFNKSDTTKDSCKVYYLNGYWKEQAISLEVENCEKNVNLIHLYIKNK